LKSKPVNSYRQLERCIQDLRRQHRGTKLVFRGQVMLYGGRVRPSIARPGSQAYLQARHPLWYAIVSDVLLQGAIEYKKWLRERAARTPSKPGQRSVRNPASEGTPKGTLGSHIEAMLQHYGARSYFVDVTKSLRVALWFAHHRHRLEEVPLSPENVPDLHLPLDPFGPMPVYDVAWYEPAWPKHKTGYLFVLSPNAFDATKGLRHGDYIDLMPNYYAARVGRQQAGLVHADVRADAGDLGDFIRAIFRFKLPLDGAPTFVTKAKTLTLFPSPDKDRMYRDILARLPFRESLEEPFALPRILRIPEYYQSYEKSAGSTQWPHFRKLDGLSLRAGFFAALANGTSQILECHHGDTVAYLGNARPILGPLSIQFMMEPTSTSEFTLEDGGAGIFIEHNPLRLGVIAEEPAPPEEARGIWVVRRGNRLWCRVFWWDASGKPQIAATHGHSFLLEEGKQLDLDGAWPASGSVDEEEVHHERDFLVLALSLLMDVHYGRRALIPGPTEPYHVLTDQILAYP
jgi:hypothetical protein